MAARHLGVQPSEFWDMTLGEIFLEAMHKQPHNSKIHYAGGLTRGDLDGIKKFMRKK